MKKHLNPCSKQKRRPGISSIGDFDRFIPSKESFSQMELTWQEREKPGSPGRAPDADAEARQLTISETNSGRFLRNSLLREGIFSLGSLSRSDPFEDRRLFSQEMLSEVERCRKIPREPFKVLEAPFLQDDFYLNVVDWSPKNVLGVGLGNAVYTWDFLSNQVTRLMELGKDNLVTAISWMGSGHLMSVGTLDGNVSVWDTLKGTSSDFYFLWSGYP